MLRESVISNKWYIISMSLSLALFIHFISTRFNAWSPISFYLLSPKWTLFTIASTNLLFAQYSKPLLVLGSYLGDLTSIEKNWEWYNLNDWLVHQNNFTFDMALFDVLVCAVLIFMLSFGLQFTFDLVISLIYKIVPRIQRRWLLLSLHWLLICGAGLCGYLSIKYYLYFGAVAVFLLALIDLLLR